MSPTNLTDAEKRLHKVVTDKIAAEAMCADANAVFDGQFVSASRAAYNFAVNEYTVQSLLAEVGRLREALENLLDEQNGPPLMRRQKEWEAAVAKGRAALAPTPPPAEKTPTCTSNQQPPMTPQ